VALVLAAIPHLFRDTLDFGLLTSLRSPVAWLAFAGLAAAAWLGHRRHTSGEDARVRPSLLWLIILLVCPIAMLALGYVFWEKALPGTSTYAVVYVLYGLLALQIAISYLFVWRRMKHQAITIGACMLSLVWSFGTFTVSGFAITGTWP
jgi:hypothetical protein